MVNLSSQIWMKCLPLIKQIAKNYHVHFPPVHLTSGTKIQDGHLQRNVNLVRELSSRAHFKDNFMLIKNWIGTMPLKFLVSLLQGGSYCKTETLNFVDICPFLCILSKIEWFEWDIWNPPYKMKTSNFRGIVTLNS